MMYNSFIELCAVQNPFQVEIDSSYPIIGYFRAY